MKDRNNKELKVGNKFFTHHKCRTGEITAINNGKVSVKFPDGRTGLYKGKSGVKVDD